MTSNKSATPDWQPDALEAFEASLNDCLKPDDLGGRRWETFAEGLTGVDRCCLPAGQIARSKVFELVDDEKIETVTVATAIMAWGDMRMNHRATLFDDRSSGHWIAVADEYRNGEISRNTCYDELRTLRRRGYLKGAGSAYFTKIIYFLTPSQDRSKCARGCIMDQWAACSINLLVGCELVLKKPSAFWISDANTAGHYEAFCSAVAALAAETGCTPDQTDRALVANGGRKPSSWRKYVIEHRTLGR